MMAWYGFWIRIAYALRLRGFVVRIQRRIKGERKAPREALPQFATPEDLETYIRARFEYRRDQTRVGGFMLPLDWVTHEEVFHARLLDPELPDGDCDDYAFFVARALLLISGVSDVLLLSSGYKGGGHTTCVYRYKSNWYLFNYKIQLIDDPNNAPQLVSNWGSRRDARPAKTNFYVFEYVDDNRMWRPAAICPKGRI